MRCVLINPYTQLISECEFGGTIGDMYNLLSPEGERPVDCFERVPLPQGNWVYVDESGLLNQRKRGFVVPTYPDPLAGIGVILGETENREDWDDSTAPLAVMQLTVKLIEWQ